MKAALVRALDGTFLVEDIDIDTPRGREVLIDVKASGLCHSDLHSAENDYGNKLPALFGHELAGLVAGVGPDVTGFAVGDRVVASLLQSCGHCAACLAGQPFRCRNGEENLRGADEPPRLHQGDAEIAQINGLGGFAAQALVHENQLVKLPDGIPFPQAAILGCAVITGVGAALNTAEIRPGDTVAVIGAGGVGLNVISGARLAGASEIIAIDLQPGKLELSRRFGATATVNPADGDPVEQVRALTNGGVTHAFEVIGLQSTTKQAIEMTKVGGTAYLIGMQPLGRAVDVEIMNTMIWSQRTLKGVFMGQSSIQRDIPFYANLYLQGRLNLDDLISREISIDEINEAYDELRGGSVARSVITSF